MRARPESRAYQGVQTKREPLGAVSAQGAVAATELLLKIDRDSPCELRLSLVLLNGAKAWDGHSAPRAWFTWHSAGADLALGYGSIPLHALYSSADCDPSDACASCA